MKVTRAVWMLVLALVSSVPLRGGISSDLPETGTSSAPVDNAVATLGKILEQAKGSYHTFLYEAHHQVDTVLPGQPWEYVRHSLLRQGSVIIREWDNTRAVNCHVLVARDVLRYPPGLSHDLWLVIMAETTDGQRAQRATKVLLAQTALVANFDKPLYQVLRDFDFPKDSVLYSVLADADFVQFAKPWPLLQQVRVSYGQVHTRWDGFRQWGFRVWVSFGSRSRESASEATQLHFSIRSSLDPFRTWGGHIISLPVSGHAHRAICIGKPTLRGQYGPDVPVTRPAQEAAVTD